MSQVGLKKSLMKLAQGNGDIQFSCWDVEENWDHGVLGLCLSS